MIGGNAPSVYLKQLQNHKHVELDDQGMDEILQTHCISPEFLRTDDFEGFMSSRKKSLLEKIAEVMGKPIVISDEVVADDLIDEDE